MKRPLAPDRDGGRGAVLAHLAIDYGIEVDLILVVAMDATGEFWCVQNQEVRT